MPVKAERTLRKVRIPEQGDDQSHRQTTRRHEGVEEDDVDDDWSEEGKRQRHVASREEQDRRDELEQEDGDEVVRDIERAHELSRQSGRRLHGDEVKEAVESEDEEDEAEQIAGDE